MAILTVKQTVEGIARFEPLQVMMKWLWVPLASRFCIRNRGGNFPSSASLASSGTLARRAGIKLVALIVWKRSSLNRKLGMDDE